MKTRSLRPMTLVFVAGLTLALCAGAQGQTAGSAERPTPGAAAPGGNVDNGQKLYTSYGCYECHGREAQGSSATGPRLAPRPIAFAAFSKYLRQPTALMPPYTSKVVSDGEVGDIYAFLQSRPQPPALESIPLLK